MKSWYLVKRFTLKWFTKFSGTKPPNYLISEYTTSEVQKKKQKKHKIQNINSQFRILPRKKKVVLFRKKVTIA